MTKNLDPQFEIETALPDTGERRAVLRQLLSSIEGADVIGEQTWAVTPKPRGFRLNIGQVEALTLSGDWFRVLLLATAEHPAFDEIRDCIREMAYKSVSGPHCVFEGTPSDFKIAERLIEPFHTEFIKSVGTTKSGAPYSTPFKGTHSGALVAYARREAEGRPSKYFVLQWNEELDRTTGAGPFGNDMSDRWTWTSGNTTKIKVDDIVVLRRTGAIKGIVGYGKVLRGSYPDMRTESNGNPTLVDVAWIATSSRPVLTKSDPRIANMPNLWVQANGAELNASDGEKLIKILSKEFAGLNQGKKTTDESEAEARRYPEGRKYEVRLSVHERNPTARLTCIEHHKPAYACQVCEMNFADKYGADIGAEFIHVHHKKPLPMGVRDTDPINDLIPICPNCHAMLHKVDPPMCPEDLKQRFRARRQT